MTGVFDERNAHPTRARSAKSASRSLVVLEAVIALNAIGGGIYGLAGSPFHSYLIPSLVLLIAVGGGMVVAVSLIVVGHRRAAEASIAAGVLLLGWITVETLIIPFSWLQPTFFVLGLAVVKLAYRQHQTDSRSQHGSRKEER